MKISVNRSMIIAVWILSSFYYLLTMIYHISENVLFLRYKTICGVMAMCCGVLLIVLLKRRKGVKFSLKQEIVILLLMIVPLISAFIQKQKIDYSLILKSELWVLLFTIFYYATLFYDGLPLKKKWIICTYCTILVLSVPLIILHLSGQGKVGAVIFPVYGCLTILPLVLHYTTYQKRYIPIMLTLIAILCTTKRAGILAAVLGLIIFYLTAGTQRSLRDKISRVIFISVLVTVFGAAMIAGLRHLGIDIVQRFRELSTDGGSGRIYIWTTIINEFRNSDLISKWFGHGINAVSQQVIIYSDVNIKAHNDFIEILFDYGYIGLTVFICFLGALVIEWKKQFSKHTHELSVYSYSIAISVVFSLFSYYFIESSIVNYMAVYWGIIFAERKLENRRMQNLQEGDPS